jgi:hypothetical protein
MKGLFWFGGTSPKHVWLFQAFLLESTEDAPTCGRGSSLYQRTFYEASKVSFFFSDVYLRLSRMPGPLGQVSTMALPGKFERNRGGEAMKRAKSRVLWARISPIQAISLLKAMY